MAITQHETENYSNEEAFYDTVISKFFDKEKMLKNFQTDTMVFAVAGKMDIVRHILSSSDYFLDIFPGDSIFIKPTRFTTDTMPPKADEEYNYFTNSLLVYTVLKNKKIELMSIYFNEKNNKILSVSNVMHTEEEGKLLSEYVNTKKN